MPVGLDFLGFFIGLRFIDNLHDLFILDRSIVQSGQLDVLRIVALVAARIRLRVEGLNVTLAAFEARGQHIGEGELVLNLTDGLHVTHDLQGA